MVRDTDCPHFMNHYQHTNLVPLIRMDYAGWFIFMLLLVLFHGFSWFIILHLETAVLYEGSEIGLVEFLQFVENVVFS